MNLEPHRN